MATDARQVTLMPDRTHWSAIAFTAAVAAVVAALAGPALLQPLPTVEAEMPRPSPVVTAAPTLDRPPSTAELHSAWVSQTAAPVALRVGESLQVWFAFRNVGSEPWIAGTPSEFRVGEVGPRPLPPDMRDGWISWDRPGRQSDRVIMPQEVATVRIGLTGTVPGTFRLGVRPVIDGIAWLEDQGVYMDVTVDE